MKVPENPEKHVERIKRLFIENSELSTKERLRLLVQLKNIRQSGQQLL